jgi:hypothetical protein
MTARKTTWNKISNGVVMHLGMFCHCIVLSAVILFVGFIGIFAPKFSYKMLQKAMNELGRLKTQSQPKDQQKAEQTAAKRRKTKH